MECTKLGGCLGFSSTKLHNVRTINENTLIFVVGNAVQILKLIFLSLHSHINLCLKVKTHHKTCNFQCVSWKEHDWTGKTSENKKLIFGSQFGIGAIAVHPQGTHFAVGEIGTNPNIEIFEFPSLNKFQSLCNVSTLLHFTHKKNHKITV